MRSVVTLAVMNKSYLANVTHSWYPPHGVGMDFQIRQREAIKNTCIFIYYIIKV